MQSNFIQSSTPGLTLPPDYFLTGVGVSAFLFLNIWQTVRVSNARKMAGVNHPTMLVPEAETQLDKKKFIYNCHQRVHGNTLEGMPFLLAMTAYLGIYNPMLACSAALSVTIGRVFYTLQYSSGDTAGKSGGFARIQYPGLITFVFAPLYYTALAAIKYYST